ncbi:phosphate ABC transporter permease subunit PstC [Candidatus Viridilinea mediisalina]|uniref:Phosphate transport system permease protein n=1 Tax=Candidatus Viridilinea mediisalina TaxID=2024553 RepID=A0A2A6REQ2_9CHLR|nr:phosphate ABC transporter permease subunit PstC [Candidatus Viridilinea mediisalina]PDW01604.1 phosphate ABC transporter permease subunit PstC [Candidatus Viridilinea mediisalina]
MPQDTQQLTTWQYIQRRTQHGDVFFWFITLSFALAVVGLVAVIGFVIWNGSELARERFGLSALFQDGWNPIRGNFGALPAVYGTLVSSMIALCLAGPFGVLIGVFLTELCPQWLKTPLSFFVELLAAIPSVVYGLWGVFVFAPFFRDHVAIPLANSVGQVFPLLGGTVTAGRSLMVTGIILAIMILPTIAAISRDVIAVVPNHQREAMLAVGATRWEVIWKAVLPYARAGIIGGMMLGLGRALGETMAALMIVGGQKSRVPESLLEPGITAAALIASELPNANDFLHESMLIFMAFVLFGITLILNGIARMLVWYSARGPVGSIRA